jgi:hypothetical protein
VARKLKGKKSSFHLMLGYGSEIGLGGYGLIDGSTKEAIETSATHSHP